MKHPIFAKFTGIAFAAVLAFVVASCGGANVRTNVTMPANSPEATELRKIAILPFETKSDYQMDMRQDLESMLISIKVNKKAYFEVYEREQVQKIMDELAFGQSGMVNEESAAKVGQMIGAQGIYFGTVIAPKATQDNYRTTRQKCTGSGKNRRCADVPVQCVRKVASLTFTPKLVNVESGRVVFSKKFDKTRNDNHCDGDMGPPMSDLTLMKAMTMQIMEEFRKEVAPYEVMLSISLIDDADGLKGGDKGKFESALEFAQAGRLDRACELWGGVANKNKRHTGTIYNLGVCAEVKGDLNGALELYNEAEKTTRKPVREIGIAINRVKQMQGSREELKSQTN